VNIGAVRRDPTATATATAITIAITIACLVGIGVQDVAAAETALAVLQQP
jgi:ornithine cyclodeaminase/alanine dehydrogenase-like protein (mu-crystallin family)